MNVNTDKLPQHDPANILLVDDQPARLLTYRAILEPLGHNLVARKLRPRAARGAMKQEFAVVLLDVKMPGMDGFETADLIHDHPCLETIPIIFVTGVTSRSSTGSRATRPAPSTTCTSRSCPKSCAARSRCWSSSIANAASCSGVNKQLAEVEQGAGGCQLHAARPRRPASSRSSTRTCGRATRSLAHRTNARERGLASASAPKNPAQGSAGQARRVPGDAVARAAQPLSPLRNASHMLMHT